MIKSWHWFKPNSQTKLAATPKRYRLVQHDAAEAGRFRFETGHSACAIVSSNQSFTLDGWILGRDSPVTGLRVSVVNSHRRDLALIDQFTPSPDIKKRYPAFQSAERAGFSIDLTTLPEFCQGQEFALELDAKVNNKWCPVTTLALIRDEYQNRAVFIVGSPRSGTTIVGNSLRKTLCSSDGYGESHILPLSNAISQAVLDYHSSSGASKIPKMMLNHVNPFLLSEQMLSVLKKQYMALIEDEWLVDKTPGGPMIRALPHIQRLWPDAKVVFVKRRGIENVASRLRKFPQVDFESHCKQWKNCMNAWARVRETLNNTIEIDQYDVLTQPAESAAKLANFLALTESQQNFLTKRFVEDRPEQTGHSVSPLALDLEKINWSEEHKSLFRQHCANDLEKWGYSDDDSYYRQVSG